MDDHQFETSRQAKTTTVTTTTQHMRSVTPTQRELSPIMNIISPKQFFVPHQVKGLSQQLQAMPLQQQQQQQQTKNKHSSQVIPHMKVKEIHHIQMIDHREEVEYWKSKCASLELTITKFRIESEDSAKYADLEKQIKIYSSEIERLTFILKDATNETNSLRLSYSSLQSEINLKIQIIKEHESNQKKNESIYKSDLQKLSQMLQSNTSNDSKRNQQLVAELERTTSQLRLRNEEYESLRIKVQDTENTYAQQNERLKREVIETHQRMSIEINFKQDEINRVNQIASSLQVALQDSNSYQAKFKFLNEEFTFKMKQKSEEIEKLKSQLLSIEKQLVEAKRYIEFEGKYMYLCQEQEKLELSLRMKTEENEKLRVHIEQLTRQLNDTSRYQDYENKIILLTSEIERLYQSFQGRNQEFEQLRQQYFNETESLKAELSRSLRSKQDELERIKISSEQKVALLSTEIERYSVQMRNKNDEMERLKQQLNSSMNSSQKVHDLESNNQFLAQEIERLNNILKIKLQETEQIRAQYQRVENVTREKEYKFNQFLSEYKVIRQLEQKLKDCYIRIFLVSSENERLTLVLSSVQVNYSEQISQSYTEKIQIITEVTQLISYYQRNWIHGSSNLQFQIKNITKFKKHVIQLMQNQKLQKDRSLVRLFTRFTIPILFNQEVIYDNSKTQTRTSNLSQKENISLNGESQRSGIYLSNNFKSMQINGRNSIYDQ